jgi:hypothetical protein
VESGTRRGILVEGFLSGKRDEVRVLGVRPLTNTFHPLKFGVRHLFIELSETLIHTRATMSRATLVIAMVSSNLADLVGSTRPGRSQHFCEMPDNEADPSDPGRVHSQFLNTSDPITNATDFTQVTNDTP